MKIYPWADPTTAAVWAKLNHPAVAPMTWLWDARPASIAAAAAALRAKKPADRCLHLWALNAAIYNHPLDGPVSFEHGIAQCRPIANAIARAMPVLARVVLDNEGAPCSWNLSPEQQAVAAAEMGVALPTDRATTIAFNAECGFRSRAAVRAAIFDAFRGRMPNAELSSWNEMRADPLDGANDPNGWPVAGEGISGTQYDPALYATRGLDPLTQTPFGCLIFNQNLARTCVRHDAERFEPWLAGDNVDNVGALASSPLWREHYFHTLLLSGGRAKLFDHGLPDLPAKVCAILDELGKIIGGDELDAVLDATTIDAQADVIATARVDDAEYPTRLVARVSFRPGVTQATIKIAGKAYTVRPDAGSVGCWFSVRLSGAER